MLRNTETVTLMRLLVGRSVLTQGHSPQKASIKGSDRATQRELTLSCDRPRRLKLRKFKKECGAEYQNPEARETGSS